MHLTPDKRVCGTGDFLHLNATIAYTWIVMLLLTVVVLADHATTGSIRSATVALAERARSDRRNHARPDQRNLSAGRRRICPSSERCFCLSPSRTSWTSCPAGARPPARFRPPRRWRSA